MPAQTQFIQTCLIMESIILPPHLWTFSHIFLLTGLSSHSLFSVKQTSIDFLKLKSIVNHVAQFHKNSETQFVHHNWFHSST